jgi:hypothetical protein
VPACQGFGDNGHFQEINVADVEITNDLIPCDESAAQCPEGWSCANIDEYGVGACNGTDTTVDCPELAPDWAETTLADPNPEIAPQAACLAMQGASGCGFEQQLQSAATALVVGDQESFLHPTHLLAILMVSDEEDCSMEFAYIDGEDKGLFEEDEVADNTKLNIACGKHPEDLLPTSHFYDAFVAAKGSPAAVVFAAVVGVPYEEQDPTGAALCQGRGDQLGGCLDQESMHLVETYDEMEDAYFFQFACTRGPEGDEVTEAIPGRRYVELANQYFGNRSFVYSICNADWSPAVVMINDMIISRLY